MILVAIGVCLASFSPVIATQEINATRSPELRKEVRQEIRDERMGERKEFKAAKKIGTRGVINKAVLTAKGSDTAPTTLTISKDGKTITVNVTSETGFRRRFGGKGSFSEIMINDSIDVIGKWIDENQTMIEAKLIRDESVQKRLAVFVGRVRSVSGSTIVLETVARGTQRVTVASTTKFVSRKETPLSLADVKEGHLIRVKGVWNTQLNTVYDVRQIKDYSLPTITPKTATTSASNP